MKGRGGVAQLVEAQG